MIENVPEVPCLFDRHTYCPEGLCPLQRKNEKNIMNFVWETRKNKGKYRVVGWSFLKKGIELTGETLCDLLFHPEGVGKFDGSHLHGIPFNRIQKQFGDHMANLRRSWVDKHDNPWDIYYIRCLVKRERAYAPTQGKT